MNELIERKAALNALRREIGDINPRSAVGVSEKRRMQGIIQGLVIATECLKYGVPAAEQAAIRHGQWRNVFDDYTCAKCSECGELYEVTPDRPADAELWDVFRGLYRFCPFCGAKMDAHIKPGASFKR